MGEPLEILTRMARELQGRLSFDETLQAIADYTAALLETPYASIRLFDTTRTRLIAICRAGEAMHEGQEVEFRVGEGLVGHIAERGTTLRTGDATRDDRFAHRPGMKAGFTSFLGVPLMSGATCTGALCAISPEPDYFTDEHERLAVLVAAVCSPWVEAARFERLSSVDPLTGTLNRRGFDEHFPQIGAQADGGIEPLSVGLVDLDHFKRVNDTHGHTIGDEVLKAVAKRLAYGLRSGDAVVRFGGEEFLLVLPGAGLEQAVRVAERARAEIEDTPVTVGDTEIHVTASFGVTQRRLGDTREQIIERADEAMYRAKSAGRNRVEAIPHESLIPPPSAVTGPGD
jgi:diguanylate cyclase (GGDEF)-like protein